MLKFKNLNTLCVRARRQVLHVLTLSVVLLASTLVPFDFADAGLLRLRIEDAATATGVTLTETGANPFPGAVVYVGPIGPAAPGGISAVIGIGTGAPILGGGPPGPFAELSLTSLVLHAERSGFMTFWLEQTDLTSGDGGALLSAVSGSLTAPDGSFVTMQTWLNPLNDVPDLGADVLVNGPLSGVGAIPAGSIAGLLPPLFFGPGAIDASNIVSGLALPGPYSLFSQVVVAFSGAGELNLDLTARVIPEPGTLLLVGIALAAIGLLRRSGSKNRTQLLR